MTWINITGVADPGTVGTVGKMLDLHPLLLEDITQTGQRAKLEESDRYVFLIARMLSFDASANAVESEQVSFLLTSNMLITFQERPGDVFEGVRDRIRNGKGRIRGMKADYLLYALLDVMIDQYFLILEKIADRTEKAEDMIEEDPSPSMLKEIHAMKRELIFIRKSIWQES